MSILLFYCWWDVLQESGKVSADVKIKLSIDRPYVNEVDYNGFSIGTRFSTSPRASYSLSHFRGTVDSVK